MLWPAATAEGWKQPVLVRWQRTFDDAMRVARAQNRPEMVAVNMDGDNSGMIDVLYSDCWVDREDRYEFDLSETPVGHRVLDPVHANKNSLRSILRQLYKYKDGMDDDILNFVRIYKPGDPNMCPPAAARSRGRT